MIYGVNYDFYKREYKQWFMELIMTFITRGIFGNDNV